MGTSGGTTKGNSTQTNNIAPELRPLFSNTADIITGLQPQIAGQYGEFFSPNVQQIPGFTGGQQQLADYQMQRAFGSPFSAPEQAALSQINQLQNTPFGSLPTTQAAIAAARDPALNELAAAGLGNSDAVGTSLAGAYAPIYAQEMAFRNQAVPMLANIGAQGAARQSQLINEAYGTQEAMRGIGEAQGQAQLNDFLRRQGLAQQFTTGILGGFPAISSITTTNKSSAPGGK